MSEIDKAVPLSLGLKDVPSGKTAGQDAGGPIEGVVLNKPPVHADHRGELVEMYTHPDFWEEPFSYAYQTSIRSGMLKGWYAHEKKSDRYHIVKGELLLFLYDGRTQSQTCGASMKVLLSDRSLRQVFIPSGVWHLSLNVSNEDAILINLPTSHYDAENPDRFHIEYDSGIVPIDVRAFFPVTFVGAQKAAKDFC